MAKELWVEKYRPKTVSEYVFKNASQRKQVKQWVQDGSIPHLLFSGSAGTGKTTLAKVLINDLDVQSADVLYINASRDNNVDTMRQKITSFCETMPWGEFKVVLLDEADYMTPNAQAILRGMMEQYHTSVRFILTCNYPNRIIPAIHSRCQGFEITKQDQVDFTARVAEILINEGAQFELETIDALVRTYYPDLRKTINTVQMNTIDGVLQAAEDTSADTAEWRTRMVELFKAGKIKEAREFLIKNAQSNEYEEIYTWLYRNLDLYTSNDNQYDECVLAIRNGLVKHTQVADVEINFSATMVEVARALA